MTHDRDHHDGCRDEGLYRKYEVKRTDGSDVAGGRHHGCRYLVLDLDHDPSARHAARLYAEDIKETRGRFAHELLEHIGKLEAGEPQCYSTGTGRALGGFPDRGDRR